ncbi:hypothetical protein AB0E69_39990 [Kribbella sp. NPDC026611]|uniref:hypothetical protein n=1 Tax=Kribbella sp. NPDC026611 TaxID=3154911 RepID=UPI0033EB0524
MTDPWTDLKTAGEVPPPSPEVLAYARAQLRPSKPARRVLGPALGAAAVVAVVVGVLGTQQSGGPTAVPPTGAAPTSKPLVQQGASCAVTYSPKTLQQVTLAFDGTVVSAVKAAGPGGLTTWTVSFDVHEWFRPSGGQQVQVRMWMPPGAGTDDPGNETGARYEIGSRLLIAGAIRDLPGPIGMPVAWGCDFSRTYDVTTATTWRKLLSK